MVFAMFQGVDGVEHLLIALDDRTLQEFIQQQEEEEGWRLHL